jgi:hypothetical protein
VEREVKEQRDILRKALQPSVIERANARNRWSDMMEREQLIVNDKIEVGLGFRVWGLWEGAADCE